MERKMTLHHVLSATPKSSTATIVLWMIAAFSMFLSSTLESSGFGVQQTLNNVYLYSLGFSFFSFVFVIFAFLYEAIRWMLDMTKTGDKDTNFPLLK